MVPGASGPVQDAAPLGVHRRASPDPGREDPQVHAPRAARPRTSRKLTAANMTGRPPCEPPARHGISRWDPARAACRPRDPPRTCAQNARSATCMEPPKCRPMTQVASTAAQWMGPGPPRTPSRRLPTGHGEATLATSYPAGATPAGPRRSARSTLRVTWRDCYVTSTRADGNAPCLVRRTPRSTATGACPVPAPAGAHRSPQRICPRRARPTPADCRPAGSASLSRRAAAHQGRATGHHRRSGRYRGP